jgi:L-tyrosine isonitrile synthase
MNRFLLMLYTFLSSSYLLATEHLESHLRDSLPIQVCYYLDNLPKINNDLCNATVAHKAVGIVDFLKEYSPKNNSGQVRNNTFGEDMLADQFFLLLQAYQPIKMRITGFPFKSINAETKVVGCFLDMAEFVGILTLHHICREIGKIHRPGAKIIIVSDSVAFADFMGVSHYEYEFFQYSAARIIRKFSDYLEFVTPSSEDFKSYLRSIRRNEQFFHEVMYNISDRYASYLPFLKEELKCRRGEAVLGLHKSENPKVKRNRLKYPPMNINQVASMIVYRSQAFEKYIQDCVPECRDTIRLSVHHHDNISKKCGISLIFGSNVTPWHNMLVLTRETVMLNKYHAAMNAHRGLYYYKFNGLILIYAQTFGDLNDDNRLVPKLFDPLLKRPPTMKYKLSANILWFDTLINLTELNYSIRAMNNRLEIF